MKKGEKKRVKRNKKEIKKKQNKKISKKKVFVLLGIILILLVIIFILFEHPSIATNAIDDGTCIPNWKCTQFTPEKCPVNEERIRTCMDLNNCGILQDKPELTQSCEKKSIPIYLIIVILGIIGLALIIIIIKRILKKEGKLNPHPKVEHKAYKEDPNYPSEIEQYYGSDQTHNFKVPVKRDPNVPVEKDGQEKFPSKYWPK